MMGVVATIVQGGPISIGVAVLLLAMSVASWVLILWKGWLLRRAATDVQLATAAFWQATDLSVARDRLAHFDPQVLLLPLLEAAQGLASAAPGTLAHAGDRSQQLTRVLRDALHAVLHRLQWGQTLLATVGSTAPFVGLLGTVWGIYHALTAIGQDGAGFRIELVSGPVGEALIMTAAGLAVAIPAVLAYNVFGRLIARIEADNEGLGEGLSAEERAVVARTNRYREAMGLRMLRIDARLVAAALGAVGHRIAEIDLRAFGGSALTDDIAVPKDRDDATIAGSIPITYVPARNTIMLSFALAWAEVLDSTDIFVGVNAVDYSGYPDCRRESLDAMERALVLGMERDFRIETPLMRLTKAETWALAEELGGRALVDLIVEETHSCYRGDRSRRHDWGYGCGACPACELRANGWARYKAARS